MEKLTIEHIAPYLPYGLQIKGNTYGEVEILSMVGEGSVYVKSQKTTAYGAWADIQDIKPILRPLSDLTIGIEHNGEKFIAGLMLVDGDRKEHDLMICEFYNPFKQIEDYSKWIRIVHNKLGEILCINPSNPKALPYHLVQKLFEWHFDVFGLIEKNLAINKNEI